MKWIQLISLLGLLVLCQAFDYSLDAESRTRLNLIDDETGISNIKTLFIDALTNITIEDIGWLPNNSTEVGSDYIFWTTYINGNEVDSGNFSLIGVGRELPTSMYAGSFEVGSNGEHNVTVLLVLDDSKLVVTGMYVAYKKGVAIIPLIVVLLLAMTTNMVELSLYTAVFVGSCIITGNLKDGFMESLDVYIIDALADTGHCYVMLFSLTLAGLVGLMEKAGGMHGFTKLCGSYAKTPRAGQFACFGIGCLIFFDDYANLLLAGQTMKPLFDQLMISREKLAFVVDATAAPIATISPISSWVGFEVNLIQSQLDRIIALMGTDDIGIKTTGLGVFLQSIKYSYYSWFMIFIVFFHILVRKDFGPMLIAERKVTIYERTDGGDGKGKNNQGGLEAANHPIKGTPLRAYNMFLPIILLIVLVFYLLVQTGTVPGTQQTVMEKIEGSDSYTSLLWGTFATTVCSIIFYLLQWNTDTKDFTLPPFKKFCTMVCNKSENGYSKATSDEDDEHEEKIPEDVIEQLSRPLISIPLAVEAFLRGMATLFPALIVLILAWATGTMMVDVGADRLFARWIVGGIPPEVLPTMTFVIAFFMALSTGTAWGTMTILFPLVLLPVYVSSNGNPSIFYSVTASILGGSVVGDHVSPISDTTIISALSSDCALLRHVATQAPYCALAIIVSLLLGYLPSGFGVWRAIVGILIGFLVIALFLYFVCVSPDSPSGRYDIFTELYLKLKKDEGLEILRQDAIKFYATGHLQDTSTTPTKDTEPFKTDEDYEAVKDTEPIDIEEPVEPNETTSEVLQSIKSA